MGYKITKEIDAHNESGRWYNPENGRLVEEVLQKNGKPARPSARHAVELKLVPSVTTILSEEKHVGLERWKTEQVLMSALTTKRFPGESDSAMVRRVLSEADRPGKESAEEGQGMHKEFELYLATGVMPDNQRGFRMVSEINAFLSARDWVPMYTERKFASRKLGYAGTVDMGGMIKGLNLPWIGDIKTRDFKGEPMKVKPYEKYCTQMCGYAKGIGAGNCVNMVAFMVDRETGSVKPRIWTEYEIQKHKRKWDLLYELWTINHFDPRA
jgi:hypothetical protein